MPLSRTLSRRELEYYSRQIVLRELGYKGQLRLKNAKVSVVGLGGLGSSIATQLTGMGVGHLRLVDRDVLEYSNLHRQHAYDARHIGYPKVELAGRRLRRLNPRVRIEELPMTVNTTNASRIVEGVDAVVDGLDRMAPRYAINRACVKSGTPYVFGSALTSMGNASTIIPEKTPCLECFYGNLDDASLPTCSTAGINPAVLSIVTGVQVSETIKLILGQDPALAGQLLVCDLHRLSFDKIEVARVEGCPVCGGNSERQPTKLSEDSVEEICSREGKRTFIINPKEILDLDMDLLDRIIAEQDYSPTIKSRLARGFKPTKEASATIMKNGTMIVEGLAQVQDATALYKKIVSRGLGFQVNL